MAWLAGWTYRRCNTIARASGAVTNYQMRVAVGYDKDSPTYNVHCQGHVLQSFDDLRFTNDAGTLLDYWIEEIDTTSVPGHPTAHVWVEIDSIGTTATYIHMYYGNASAPAVSNGTDTFILFDDFERGVNGDDVGGIWSTATGKSPGVISTASPHSGTRSMLLEGGSPNVETLTDLLPTGNIGIDFNILWDGNDYFYQKWGGYDNIALYLRYTTSTNLLNIYNYGWVATTVGITPGTWTTLGFNDFLFTSYWYNTDIWRGTLTEAYASVKNNQGIGWRDATYYGKFAFIGGTGTGSTYIDNFRVRNFRQTQPVWKSLYPWEAEQSADDTGVDFVGSPTSGTRPLTVDFTDLSVPKPVTWSWTFGDGNVSAIQNPSNVYVAPGLYDVSLTNTGLGGSYLDNYRLEAWSDGSFIHWNPNDAVTNNQGRSYWPASYNNFTVSQATLRIYGLFAATCEDPLDTDYEYMACDVYAYWPAVGWNPWGWAAGSRWMPSLVRVKKDWSSYEFIGNLVNAGPNNDGTYVFRNGHAGNPLMCYDKTDNTLVIVSLEAIPAGTHWCLWKVACGTRGADTLAEMIAMDVDRWDIEDTLGGYHGVKGFICLDDGRWVLHTVSYLVPTVDELWLIDGWKGSVVYQATTVEQFYSTRWVTKDEVSDPNHVYSSGPFNSYKFGLDDGSVECFSPWDPTKNTAGHTDPGVGQHQTRGATFKDGWMYYQHGSVYARYNWDTDEWQWWSGKDGWLTETKLDYIQVNALTTTVVGDGGGVIGMEGDNPLPRGVLYSPDGGMIGGGGFPRAYKEANVPSGGMIAGNNTAHGVDNFTVLTGGVAGGAADYQLGAWKKGKIWYSIRYKAPATPYKKYTEKTDQSQTWVDKPSAIN